MSLEYLLLSLLLTLSSYLFMMQVNMWYGLVHRFITLLCMNFTYIFVVLSQLLWTVFFLHYCVCLKYHSVIALVDTICVVCRILGRNQQTFLSFQFSNFYGIIPDYCRDSVSDTVAWSCYLKSFSLKFRQIHRKTPQWEFLF